mmetsp:Transcript_38290/g.113502  ORF Transcript_38290/g.113502 Transcript_38290/m.113502 type:complete len:1280 (-) Transcript_38290:256-4095(-)
MALKTAAAAALLALLLPAVAARTLSSALDSAKDQCLTASAPGLDKAGCEDCVESLAQLNRPLWGCYGQLCQDDELFATTDYPADGAAFGTDSGGSVITCTDCLAVYETETCLACATSVPGEYSDLAADEVGAARAYCLACNNAPSTADESAPYPAYPGKLPGFQTASSNQGKEAEYRAACGVCANIPETADGAGAAARVKCAQCMSSTFAMPLSEPGGYLTANEIDRLKEDLGKTTLAATDYPLTDFGKCAFIANLTFSVSQGRVEPTGIYSTCAWSTADFPYPQPTSEVAYPLPDATIAGCLDCIDATVDNTTKAYACGLCRNPDWTESDAAVATECYACVENVNVTDAWGCSNCYKLEADDDTDTFERDECVDCVTNNLYGGAVGTYNWACGECAGIATLEVRELCRQCIMTPAMDSFLADTLEDDLLDPSWVGNASEIICSCVDMAKLSTWGENAPGALLDWYSYDCPNCTAIQKMCYMRRNISWPINIIPDPRPSILAIPIDAVSGDPIEAGPADGYISADLCSPPASAAWVLWEQDLEVAWGVFQELSNKGCLPATGFEDFEVAVAALSAGCAGTPVDLTCVLLSAVPPSEDYVVIHLDDFIDVPEETGFDCVECMKEFNALGQDKYMYACNEYCMNPYTMRNGEQIEQCYKCVADIAANPEASVSDHVGACETCIQGFTGSYPLGAGAFNDYDTQKRTECMECINKPTSFPENRDWACVACGQLLNPNAAEQCYACLEENVMDPCQCVDGWKAGWLCYEPTASCILDADGIAALLDNTTDSPGLDGGYVTNLATPFNTDTCAAIAQKEGADLFALLGDTCFYFQGNVQYLTQLAVDFLNTVNDVCPLSGQGVVQLAGCEGEPGLVQGGPEPACECSGTAQCITDEDAPTCLGGLLTATLAPWQRRCECGNGEVYVEGTGCVPDADVPNELYIESTGIVGIDGVSAECVMGKKLAFCLSDRGTYGSGRNYTFLSGPFNSLNDGMFADNIDTSLSILYADEGIPNDALAYDFLSPGGRHHGWSLTADKDDGAGGEIRYHNNRDRSDGSSAGTPNPRRRWPLFCDTDTTACVNKLHNVKGSVTSTNSAISGAVLTWTGERTTAGIDMKMDVTMPGADAQAIFHEMTITNNGIWNLSNVKFVFSFDPDQQTFGGDALGGTYTVYNQGQLSQIGALDRTVERLPAILFSTCDTTATAGIIFQNQQPDHTSYADVYATLGQYPTLEFGSASTSISGNFAMYQLFQVSSLEVGESVTFTWTVGFLSDAIASATTAAPPGN